MMFVALRDGMLATDLADYLVRKGVPFRQSHRIVGQAVLRAEDAGVQLRELSLSDYRTLSDAFEQDLFEVFDFERSVASRDVPGGTAPEAVRRQLARARKLLKPSRL